VAGFVGTSNTITGAAARTLFGRDGAFSVRPEHLKLAHAAGPAGTVAEVIYAGPVTRYVIDLDAGVRVTVSEQNTRERHERGTRTTVTWDPGHVIEIG
jgi:putative spermidine/putrescine transport system ATP-binding protein